MNRRELIEDIATLCAITAVYAPFGPLGQLGSAAINKALADIPQAGGDASDIFSLVASGRAAPGSVRSVLSDIAIGLASLVATGLSGPIGGVLTGLSLSMIFNSGGEVTPSTPVQPYSNTGNNPFNVSPRHNIAWTATAFGTTSSRVIRAFDAYRAERPIIASLSGRWHSSSNFVVRDLIAALRGHQPSGKAYALLYGPDTDNPGGMIRHADFAGIFAWAWGFETGAGAATGNGGLVGNAPKYHKWDFYGRGVCKAAFGLNIGLTSTVWPDIETLCKVLGYQSYVLPNDFFGGRPRHHQSYEGLSVSRRPSPSNGSRLYARDGIETCYRAAKRCVVLTSSPSSAFTDWLQLFGRWSKDSSLHAAQMGAFIAKLIELALRYGISRRNTIFQELIRDLERNHGWAIHELPDVMRRINDFFAGEGMSKEILQFTAHTMLSDMEVGAEGNPAIVVENAAYDRTRSSEPLDRLIDNYHTVHLIYDKWLDGALRPPRRIGVDMNVIVIKG